VKSALITAHPKSHNAACTTSSIAAGNFTANKFRSAYRRRGRNPCRHLQRTNTSAACRVFDEAFQGVPHLICYAVKAIPTIKSFAALPNGYGLDIVSGGELFSSPRAGGSRKRSYFPASQDGRRNHYALDSGILFSMWKSGAELDLTRTLRARRRSESAFRSARTRTGRQNTSLHLNRKASKQVWRQPAGRRERCTKLRQSSNLDVIGVSCHIGSQITENGSVRRGTREHFRNFVLD